VKLALEAGIDEVNQNDFQQALASHSEKLMNEALIQLIEE
jgi:hypothetical protein